MDRSTQEIADFGVALNEATLVGIELDPAKRWAGLTLAVLSLPEGGGPQPSDPRIQLILQPVGRLAASLRHGSWDDEHARVEPVDLDRLPAVVAVFDQQPVYHLDLRIWFDDLRISGEA